MRNILQLFYFAIICILVSHLEHPWFEILMQQLSIKGILQKLEQIYNKKTCINNEVIKSFVKSCTVRHSQSGTIVILCYDLGVNQMSIMCSQTVFLSKSSLEIDLIFQKRNFMSLQAKDKGLQNWSKTRPPKNHTIKTCEKSHPKVRDTNQYLDWQFWSAAVPQ